MDSRQPSPEGAGVFAKTPPKDGAETPASGGTILLSFEDPGPLEVPGLLTARDEEGFRVQHHCFTLRPGQVVRFEHLLAEGQARVVSTELQDGHVESHFWVVTGGD